MLDDNRQLWLCCVNNVKIAFKDEAKDDESDSYSEEKKGPPTFSPARPSLPSLNDHNQSSTNSTKTPSESSSRSIFHKKGSGSNAVWVCSKGMHELVGMMCWSDAHSDGTHSIKMQALFEKVGVVADAFYAAAAACALA